MKIKNRKWIGAGIFAVSLLALAAQPQKVRAEEQLDGVMGQSIEDETNVVSAQKELNQQILKNATSQLILDSKPMLGASSYTQAFLDASFTTDSDYTNITYYHKAELEGCELFNGIDVSWWQTNDKKNTAIDWATAHDAGIDFAFVRVASRDTSDGSIYTDTSADSHIQEAVANDVNVGLYIFSQALNEEEAVEEAEYVLDLVDEYGWNITMPIVMDREAGKNKRLTAGKLKKAKETAICQAFADTINEAGYHPYVYASLSWINNYIDTDNLSDCGIWLARYRYTTTSNSVSGTPYADVPFDYDFWQYSSAGKVDGYAKNLDVDFWYKDMSDKTTGLKMKSNTANSINLSWDVTSDVQKYRVYRYDNTSGSYKFIKAVTGTSYTDTNLTAGQAYQYKVRGQWTYGGTNYYSGYSSALTAVTLPEQVKNVTAKAGKDNVALQWDEVSGADGYRIFQYDEGTQQYVKLADVKSDTTGYTVENLVPNTEYRYKICAYKQVNAVNYWGEYSTEVVTKTQAKTLDKVQGLTVETVSSTSLELSWDPVEEADGYRIYRLNTATGKYVRIKTVKGEDTVLYKNDALLSATKYTYKVRAYATADGKTIFGRCSAATSAETKPAQVKGLKLTTKSSSITLKWKKQSNVTGYQIYRYNASTGKYEKIKTIKGTSTVTYTNKGLKKGTTYKYKVRAYKTSGTKKLFGSFSTATKIKAK